MKSTVEDTVTFNENRENRITNLKRCYYFNIPTLFTAPNTNDFTQINVCTYKFLINEVCIFLKFVSYIVKFMPK